MAKHLQNDERRKTIECSALKICNQSVYCAKKDNLACVLGSQKQIDKCLETNVINKENKMYSIDCPRGRGRT